MEAWTQAAEAATRHGLGIVLAVMLGLLFVLVVRRMLKSQEADRATYREIIDDQRELINGFKSDMFKLTEKLLDKLIDKGR